MKRGAGFRRQVALVLATSVLSAWLATTATVIAIAPALSTAAPTAASSGSRTSDVIQVSTSGSTPSSAPATSGLVVRRHCCGGRQGQPLHRHDHHDRKPTGSGRRAVSGTGVGSGVIYTSSGYILTNAHVVEGGTTIKVTLSDGREFPATVVKSDAVADIAIVKIDVSGLTVATIGKSSGLLVGQTVIAIGSPLGDYTESVTTGVLSGTGRTITVADDLTGQPRTLKNLSRPTLRSTRATAADHCSTPPGMSSG